MAKTPFSAKKHDINTLNSGYQYTTDDQMSIEALNNTIENSFYASNIAENVANQLSDLDPNEKIEFKGSNPNLLLNPSFAVNQKGRTVYKDFAQYSVDKWWLTTSNGIITKTDNGINLEALSAGYAYVNQYMVGAFERLKGKTITFSVCVNGQIYYKTGTVPSTLPTERVPILQINTIPNSAAVGVWCEKGSGDLIVQFGVTPSHNYDINWAKLEVGSLPTQFNPNNPNYDLISCSSAGKDLNYRTTNAYNSYINPNLLINGDFRINQRGKTSYTGMVYCVDRWIARDAKVEVITNGVKVIQNGIQWFGINQSIEDVELFKGKVVTLSIKIKNMNMGGDALYFGLGNSSVPYTRGTTIATAYPVKDSGIYSLTTKIPETLNNKYLNVVIQNSIGEITSVNSFELEWVKLEFGAVATSYVPRLYAEELALCQRYFLKINGNSTAGLTGLVYAAGEYADINLKVPVPMMKVPSITINSLPKIRYEGGSDISVTDVKTSAVDNNSVLLRYMGSFKSNVVCASYGLNATLEAEIV